MHWWSYLLANAGITGVVGFLFKLWIEHGRDKKLEAFKATLERQNSAWSRLQEMRAEAIRTVYGEMTGFMMYFTEMTKRLREFRMVGERERHIQEMQSMASKLQFVVLSNVIYFNDSEATAINNLLNSTREFAERCYALPSTGATAEEDRLKEEMIEFIRTKWVVAMEGMANEFQQILGVSSSSTRVHER